MPAIWLAWSMIAFVVSILSFVWRTGASADPADGNRRPLTSDEALAIRVVVTFIFCLGLLHFVMIIQTFRSYSGLTSRRIRRFRRAEEGGSGPNAEERPGERNREMPDSRKEYERGRPGEKGTRAEVIAAAGLGLTGISSSLKTFGSASAVLIEESDPEKKASGSIRQENSARPSVEGGQGMGGSRPRISPKL